MKADNMSTLPERGCLIRWQLIIMDRRELTLMTHKIHANTGRLAVC